jgi:serine/threonine protein kinase
MTAPANSPTPAPRGLPRKRYTLRRPSAFIERVGRERLGRELRGKWRLERILGIGGMATVYEARHRNGSRVAVKMLHPTLSASSPLCERFLREGYVANLVAHPGVPRVLDDDVDETDGSAFLVMELIDGCTLEERACMGTAGDFEVLKIARDVLEILAAAHAKGVVHRDLKPDNLLIDRDGRVRVLDFGIARLLDESDTLATTTGAPFGTPAFISPEQALGRRDLVSGATDIYSLGATLFALATGEFVHPSEQAQELVVLAATRRARSVAPLAPHLSPDVAAMIDRALRFEPKARFRTAREMLAEVDRIETARRTPSDVTSIDSVREAMALPVRSASHSRLGGFTSVLLAGALSLLVGGFAFTSSLDTMRSKNARADGAKNARPSAGSAAPLDRSEPTPAVTVGEIGVVPAAVTTNAKSSSVGGGPRPKNPPGKTLPPRKYPRKHTIDVGY